MAAQFAVGSRRWQRLKFVISLVCNLLTTIRYPSLSSPVPLASTPDLSWPNSHTHSSTHTLSMCALCHHLLDSSLRDFSSRVAMSVCLRFLCACCRIAFTTTTNTTIANYSLMPSLSLPLSLSLTTVLFLSVPAVAHSFIHLFILLSQPHAHAPHISRTLPTTST